MFEGLKRRVPILGNLYLGQVLFGVAVALLVADLVGHARGTAPLAKASLVFHWLGLALLTLVFGVYLQNVHKFGLVPDYSLKCRFCNGPVNRYSEFCEHCGADLIAEEKLVHCPKCGVELYEGTKHCPECGARISRENPKKAKREEAKRKAREAEEAGGWDAPIDAVSGFPPEDRP